MRIRTLLVLTSLLAGACSRGAPVVIERTEPTPAVLERQCSEVVGAPRIEEAADGVFVALGYDLANTTLIRTADGNVVIDPGMSPARARPVREALLARSPGPVRAIVLTHSHIDHVGGASIWQEDDTEIWATDRFTPHFFKQYAQFMPAELRRGAMQFGYHLPDDLIPCSALGRRTDLDAASQETGVRLPTRTFTGRAAFTVGGVEIVLVEAHGETHDQLFVWLPGTRTLMPGDNIYEAFPNLYTIRGTSPRPVDDWIESLDAMRALSPEVLVPSHTRPVHGTEEVAAVLTAYRDGIQWVRDETVRGANRGDSVDALAERIALPEHLARHPYLAELYGQIDWSVRAIYGNHLGWFDERAHALYPMDGGEAARREISLMGGADAVLAKAERALAADDPRWAIHLLEKIRLARHEGGAIPAVDERLAQAYRALASRTYNTNGRAYLFETALDAAGAWTSPKRARLGGEVLDAVPLDNFFSVMPTRLKPEESGDVHESLRIAFTDVDRSYTITVRRGVAEIVEGEPLPGTPEPIGTIEVDASTWRRLAVQGLTTAEAVASGSLAVDGNPIAVGRFMNRFEKGL